MKKYKKVTAVIAAVSLSVLMTVPAFAGTWQQLDGGEYWQKKYVEDNGSYTTNGWQLIDGKWYHFDADGYLDVGVKTIDGKAYLLLYSGAMETNKDYGFASCDADGLWTIKDYPYEGESNIFNDYCKQYGINIDFNALFNTNTYTISCPAENLPKDSEGNCAEGVVAIAIVNAIARHSNTEGVERATYYYSGGYNPATGMFTLTLTVTDGSLSILRG